MPTLTLPYKIAAIALAVALMTAGLIWLDKSRQAIGYTKAVGEYAAAAVKATAAARLREQQLQLKASEAQNEATKRNAHLSVVTNNLRAELGRLQRHLAAVNSDLPNLAADAARERIATLTELLRESTEEAARLAEKADRHASDSLMYQNAWPK